MTVECRVYAVDAYISIQLSVFLSYFYTPCMKVICFHRWNILKYDEGSTDVQKGKEAAGGRGREKYEGIERSNNSGEGGI